jgi:hypothetical protein
MLLIEHHVTNYTCTCLPYFVVVPIHGTNAGFPELGKSDNNYLELAYGSMCCYIEMASANAFVRWVTVRLQQENKSTCGNFVWHSESIIAQYVTKNL